MYYIKVKVTCWNVQRSVIKKKKKRLVGKKVNSSPRGLPRVCIYTVFVLCNMLLLRDARGGRLKSYACMYIFLYLYLYIYKTLARVGAVG